MTWTNPSLASAYMILKEMVTQKLTWTIQVPEDARGHYPIDLTIGQEKQYSLTLAFGHEAPPTTSRIEPGNPKIYSLGILYPRALTKRVFCTPFKSLGGPGWDIGWLGVYIMAYLGLMILAKCVFRVP